MYIYKYILHDKLNDYNMYTLLIYRCNACVSIVASFIKHNNN